MEGVFATFLPSTDMMPLMMHSLRPVPRTMQSYSPSARAGISVPSGSLIICWSLLRRQRGMEAIR